MERTTSVDVGQPTERAAEQLRGVFAFLREWHALRQSVQTRWREHPWVLDLTNLPDHPAVDLGMSADDAEAEHVLCVTRPRETPCPTPPDSIVDWLLPGWKSPVQPASVLESKNELVEDDTVTIRFDDEQERVEAFKQWRERRAEWAEAETVVRKVGGLFQRLYELHGRLRREGDSFQFVLGEGMLAGRTDRNEPVLHPIIQQRVELHFDPETPSFTIQLSDSAPELDTTLLRATEAANAGSFAELRESLKTSDLDLLHASRVKEMMARIVNTAFPRVRITDGPTAVEPNEGVATWPQPVLMLMPRRARFADAIDGVLDRLEQGEELPETVSGIVGVTGSPVPAQRGHTADPPTTPSASKRELRREMLFTKPANDAQSRILERLRSTKTVVVQGPPGTGKTHTIGNILGHLLSQGKRVLVTSHTSKALRVLRKSVAEPLRPLCVSVLDSDADSRSELEESVFGITRKLSKSDPESLREEATKLRAERDGLLDRIERLEDELHDALADEYRDITVAGEGHAPSEAAKRVRRELDAHGWIPGDVAPYKPCPLDDDELNELYATNAQISPEQERELDAVPPPLDATPTADAIESRVERLRKLEGRDLTIPDDAWDDGARPTPDEIGQTWQVLRKAIEALGEFRGKPHLIDCVEAGRRGGESYAAWVEFADHLTQERAAIEAATAQARRAAVELAAELTADPDASRDADAIVSALRHEKLFVRLTAGRLGLLLRPRWRRLTDLATVDGRSPRSAEDYEAIAARLSVDARRRALVRRWRAQLEEHPTLREQLPTDHPEIAFDQHAASIRFALQWHEQSWIPADAAMKRIGIALGAALRRVSPQPGRFADLNRIFLAANEHLGPWLKRRLDRLKLDDTRRQLDGHAAALTMHGDGGSSPLVAELRRAILDRDPEAYRKAYAKLEELHRLRDVRDRRRTLLDRLAEHAPEWASRVESRRGPHGHATPPGPGTEAWLIKQFLRELDARGRKDVSELQRRLADERRRLMDITIELVDRLAWATQHGRTGRSERQALQGWLQTINTRGYRSGVRSNQLQRQARDLLVQARTAVPVWIMTLSRAIETLDFSRPAFDVVIVDEASQCDLMGLLPLSLADAAIIVGDDKQVSPSGVGENLSEIQKLIDEYLGEIPTRESFTGRFSLYDFGTQSFGDVQRLTEHFRCAEPIIAFSNELSYAGEIVPLRDTTGLPRQPHVVQHRVADGSRDGDWNEAEAIEVASLVAACLEQDEYDGCTFGVISLLKDRQAFEIDALLQNHLAEAVYERAKILCGTPPHFQGDERDVVFLSMVDSASPDGPLRTRRDDDLKKRYNVAASRARDQLWVVHSLSYETDLAQGDLRRRLLEHVASPDAADRDTRALAQQADSEFERRVGEALIVRGYRIEPQHRVGAWRIDLVAHGADGQRAAIECDGDRYHGLDRLKDDLDRQHVLERLGWRFIRVRGSDFFRDEDAAIDRVMRALDKLGIQPIGSGASADEPELASSDLVERVRRRAQAIRDEWAAEDEAKEEEADPDVSMHASTSADRAALDTTTGVQNPTASAVGVGSMTDPNHPSSSSEDGEDPAELIIACLREAGHSLGKAEILSRTGIQPQQWQPVITTLVASARVHRSGRKRGTKYAVAT